MEKGTCRMGMFVRNRIDGFEGCVIGKVYWLFGCDRILLFPKKRSENALVPNEKVMLSEELLERVSCEEEWEEKEFVKPDLEKYFGMLCHDKVTGFEGVAIGCVTSMFSSDSYALEPLAKKNKKLGSYEWFDVGRLEIIERHVTPKQVSVSRPGGCEFRMSQSLTAALC